MRQLHTDIMIEPHRRSVNSSADLGVGSHFELKLGIGKESDTTDGLPYIKGPKSSFRNNCSLKTMQYFRQGSEEQRSQSTIKRSHLHNKLQPPRMYLRQSHTGAVTFAVKQWLSLFYHALLAAIDLIFQRRRASRRQIASQNCKEDRLTRFHVNLNVSEAEDLIFMS